MMGFYLFVIPIFDKFGHMDEHLELLSDGLVFKGPFVVAEVSYISIVLSIIPSVIFLVFSLLSLWPRLLPPWLDVSTHI